jgi:hypothetical protein
MAITPSAKSSPASRRLRPSSTAGRSTTTDLALISALIALLHSALLN